MGNKQVSQLSMFDYVIGISIGSIAAEFATELENPERTIIAMVVYALIAFAVSVVTDKSTYARKIITGRPLILFHKGKLYRKNFKKSHIDITDFLTLCRSQGYFDLSKIETAIFENNGSLSILPVETNRPTVPSDFNIEPTQQELLINVILDGKVKNKNLEKSGKNRVWLDKQLSEQGFSSPKEVFLAMVDNINNNLLAYPRETKNKTFDPFE